MSKRPYYRVAALLVLAGVLLAGRPAQAQGGELPFGTPVEAVLPEGATHTYTFRSDGGEAITIQMTAGAAALDPILELYGPDGALLAFNDDAAMGQRDALLDDVALVEEGVYTLLARSYGNRGNGAYTLLATRRAAAVPEVGEGQPISLGETVYGEIAAPEQADRWTFAGTAGQVISIALNHTPASALDPLLELRRPDGRTLAESDDDGGGTNSLISGLVLPADGTYTIVARSWGSTTTGAYTLTLSEGAVTPPQVGPAAGHTGVIEPGQTVEALLTPGTVDEWTLVGREGQIFSAAVYAEGDSFDTVLYIVNANGAEVAYDDDGGPGLNSMVLGWAVPADGVYTIRVGSYSGQSGGPYALTVQPGRQRVLPEGWLQGHLTFGLPQRGTFAAGQLNHVWLFEAEADQWLTLDYQADSLGGLYVEIMGERGEDLGYMEPGLLLPIDATGTYYVFVQGYEPGGYTLTLSETEPPPINTGAIEPGQTIGVSLAPGAEDEWTFVGRAGQVFTIAVYAEGDRFDTVLRIVDASGVEIAFDDDGATGLNSMLRGWAVPADGAYTIRVGSYSGREGGPYQLIVMPGERFVFPESWVQGPLPVRQAVEGRFDEGRLTHVWTFEAGAGQSLALDYAGDVSVEVLDARGETYLSIVPGAPAFFDQAGLYYLVVRGYQAGSYALKMYSVEGGPSGGRAREITVGETVTAALASGAEDTWTFTGETGQVISIAVTAAGDYFDPVLSLRDGSGREIALDDDSGGDLNSLIAGFSLPTDDEYAIVVRSFNGRSGGPYTLSLTAGRPGPAPSG